MKKTNIAVFRKKPALSGKTRKAQGVLHPFEPQWGANGSERELARLLQLFWARAGARGLRQNPKTGGKQMNEFSSATSAEESNDLVPAEDRVSEDKLIEVAETGKIVRQIEAEMFMEMREEYKKDVRMGERCIVHSGAVIAGVIGERKFSYDLWGNTVNIASRMESEGIADQIQISAETRNMLSDTYRTSPRGEISVKGHRSRLTYLLEGYV